MSASIGKRDAEFAAQLNKVREDFEVERDGLRRSIASITAATENSKWLKKESAGTKPRGAKRRAGNSTIAVVIRLCL